MQLLVRDEATLGRFNGGKVAESEKEGQMDRKWDEGIKQHVSVRHTRVKSSMQNHMF